MTSYWSSDSGSVRPSVFHVAVQQPGAIQLAENTQHAARAVHVFHMVFLGTRRDFTQLRHFAGQLVDIAHGEVDFGFLRGGQQVQNGVGGTAHGDIQRHGVFKRRFTGNVARQRTGIVLLVVAFGQLNDAFTGVEEQLFTIGVGRQQRAVARLRRPSASVRQFMELAVNIPEQEPQVGQAERSTWSLCSSDTFGSAP
jgi:hypothetical protein